MLYFSTNRIFWKNLVSEIWAKMFLASQIAGFSNQLYLEQNDEKT